MTAVQRISPPAKVTRASYCEKGVTLYNNYRLAAHKLQTARRVSFLTANDVAALLQAWEWHRAQCETCR